MTLGSSGETRWWRIVLVAVACFAGTVSVGSPTQDTLLAVGQEWSLRGSPESTVKIIIGRIEPWRDKTAVHIAIVDIPVAEGPGAIHVSEVAHAPFEESALLGSIGRLVATGVATPRDFETGYKQWKDHNGGIYTVSVAEALGLVATAPHRESR